MGLTGTVHDWTKTYAFLYLLGNGKLCFGDTELQPDLLRSHRLISLSREDESGLITYHWDENLIYIHFNSDRYEVEKTECNSAALTLLNIIREKQNISSAFAVPEISLILEKLIYTDFSTTGADGYDFTLSPETPGSGIGVKIKSLLAPFYLLPPNRAANFKYDILHIKFSNPETKRINRIDGKDEIRKRLAEIDVLGARIKYTAPENKIFLHNLSMIDLHFPKLMAEATRLFYTTDLKSISLLADVLKKSNPYKINDELINNHRFYEYKIKLFLHALACGMRPAKIFRGYGDENFQLWVTPGGQPLLYSPKERELFDNMLFNHTSLSEVDCESYKFGFIEKENNQWLIKLNLTLKI